MSSKFKQQTRSSRFSDLNEEIRDGEAGSYRDRDRDRDRDSVRGNSFKGDCDGDRDRDGYRNRRERRDNLYYQERSVRNLEKQKELKEKEIQKALASENFPELVSTKKSVITEENRNLSFADKAKIAIINENEDSLETEFDKDFDSIPVGWAFIKKDKTNNSIVIKKECKRNKARTYELELESEFESESESIYDVLASLTKLYEKRRREYIDKWGHDEYNFLFKFPNYDYEYFDRLDDLYEAEIYELYNSNKNHENEYDYENDYDYDYISEQDYYD